MYRFFLISARASFMNVNSWVGDARNTRGEDMIIMIVGNKIDMSEKR
jgi:Ras-related protein Rab-6A